MKRVGSWIWTLGVVVALATTGCDKEDEGADAAALVGVWKMEYNAMTDSSFNTEAEARAWYASIDWESIKEPLPDDDPLFKTFQANGESVLYVQWGANYVKSTSKYTVANNRLHIGEDDVFGEGNADYNIIKLTASEFVVETNDGQVEEIIYHDEYDDTWSVWSERYWYKRCDAVPNEEEYLPYLPE